MVDSERFGELGCEMFGERLQPVRVEGTRFVEEPFPFVDAPCLRELAAGGELAGGPGRRSGALQTSRIWMGSSRWMPYCRTIREAYVRFFEMVRARIQRSTEAGSPAMRKGSR